MGRIALSIQIGVELGVLVSAAGNTAPKYGQRHYDLSRGSANRRKVDLQPYRRLYGAMLLQQVRAPFSVLCLCGFVLPDERFVECLCLAIPEAGAIPAL